MTSVTEEMIEAADSIPRDDDTAAASCLYQCADCVRDEADYSCFTHDQVCIIAHEVICLDHARDRHPGAPRRKVPDIAAKLRRQRMALATAQRALAAKDTNNG